MIKKKKKKKGVLLSPQKSEHTATLWHKPETAKPNFASAERANRARHSRVHLLGDKGQLDVGRDCNQQGDYYNNLRGMIPEVNHIVS